MKQETTLTILLLTFLCSAQSAQQEKNVVWLPKANNHVTFCTGDPSTYKNDEAVLQSKFDGLTFDYELEIYHCMHALVDGAIAAVALYEQESVDTIYLLYLATAKAYDKQGIAQELIHQLATQTKCKSMRTLALPESIGFFDKQGFQLESDGIHRVKNCNAPAISQPPTR